MCRSEQWRYLIELVYWDLNLKNPSLACGSYANAGPFTTIPERLFPCSATVLLSHHDVLNSLFLALYGRMFRLSKEIEAANKGAEGGRESHSGIKESYQRKLRRDERKLSREFAQGAVKGMRPAFGISDYYILSPVPSIPSHQFFTHSTPVQYLDQLPLETLDFLPHRYHKS